MQGVRSRLGHTRITKPESMLYDSERAEYFMLASKKTILDFAIAVGTYPSEINHNKDESMAYAVWAGHSATVLRKRLNK